MSSFPEILPEPRFKPGDLVIDYNDCLAEFEVGWCSWDEKLNTYRVYDATDDTWTLEKYLCKSPNTVESKQQQLTYVVVTASNLADFLVKVNTKMQQGYTAQGGICVQEQEYLQAMLLKG